MKHWIKIQGTLFNLDDLKTINTPIYITATPGYWQIDYCCMNSNAMGYWTFQTEIECKSTFADIEKVLTDTNKFIE